MGALVLLNHRILLENINFAQAIVTDEDEGNKQSKPLTPSF